MASPHSLEHVACAWLEHRSKAWTAGTRKMITASLENDVFPVLGMRPIAELQPREIRGVVQRIDDRGAGETTGRVFQRLRAICRYAVAHDSHDDRPGLPLKPSEIPEPRRTRHRPALGERDVPAFLQKLLRG